MLQTLNFDGTRLVNAAATFFRYESGSAGGVDESIRVRADGNDLGIFWPGDSVELPIQAGTWEITATTPSCKGLVRLGLGRVASTRLSTVVAVTDRISEAVQQRNANDTAAVIVAGGFNLARTVVSPEENVRGVKIRGWASAVKAGAAGSTDNRLIAAPVAPAELSPLQSYVIGGAGASNGVTYGNGERGLNILLPPKWGVYVVVQNAGDLPVKVENDFNCEVL